ncbi:MAG: pyruvate kinase [Clostridia bacterium]|jgi:pyruvate kinase|nr:pyruvate kinase [Clostridia bacterium]
MKKTKIVCTLGPASEREEVISAMADAGMNVARINFSHGTHEEHAEKIALVKKIREQKQIALPVMLDTKGPEFRIKTFETGKIVLKKGDVFTFTTDDVVGDQSRVAVSYRGICEDMTAGDKILLNNGLMVFEVTKVKKPDVVCTVLVGGELSNRKSMFFPDKILHLEYLSEQDKSDLLFGIEQGVDFIACSFVSKAQDITDVRNFLSEHGSTDIDLIAKIENRAGVNNLAEILEVSDGIMIGRGDMGVEIPYEELPDIQKTIINACRIAGKRCITATEMLESMIHNPRPTRAEISDVANAVYDGSSAVMLSGETAAGAYPVEAVKAMSRIAMQAESKQSFIQSVDEDEYLIRGLSDALSHSACLLARDIQAKAIVVCTRTGGTAKMVSRFRPMIDIIGMTTDPRSYQKLALSWGVMPALSEEYHSVDVLFHFAKQAAKDSGIVKSGDVIVITGGTPNGKSGNSNLINIETV